MILLRLYWEFFKTGLFSVGGGLATLPFLTDMGRRTGWFGAQDISNMIAVSESTPGPMGVNMATFVGFQTAGIPGSVIATLGLISPAILTIMLIYRVLDKFRSSPLVERVFYGLRPASTALITAAGIGVARLCLFREELFHSTGVLRNLFNFPLIVLAIAIFAAWKRFKKHPVFYIAAAALVGVVFQL